MNILWRRIARNVWALDETWKVVEETPGQWRVYRGNAALLESFPAVALAMAEAERVKASTPPSSTPAKPPSEKL